MKIRLFTFFCLLILLQHCTKTENKTVLLGSVLTDRQTDLINGAILNLENGEKSDIDINSSGKYQAKLAPGIYILQLATTDHEPREDLLWITDQDSINISTKLRLYHVNRDADEIIAIGNWGNFDFRNAIQFNKIDPNTFKAELPVSKWQLSYQIHGATHSLQMINGTDQHYFNYDGSGHYYSVIDTSATGVEITFNLNHFSFERNESRTTIENQPELQILFDRFNDFNDYKDDFATAYYQSYMQGNALEQFTFDFTTLADQIVDQINKTTSEKEKSLLALHLFDMISNGAEIDQPDLIKDLVLTIGAENPLWNYRPFHFFTAFSSIYNINDLTGYLEKTIKKGSNHQLVAAATFLLMRTYYDNGEIRKVKPLFEKLQTKYSDTEFSEWAKMTINPDNTIHPGAEAPQFTVTSLKDSSPDISLNDFKGKWLLLDFWATWCGPCIEEMPNLHAVFDKYGNENFTILSLSFDDSKDQVHNFHRTSYPMPWNHAFVTGGFESDLAKTYEITGIPKIILINPNGKIAAEGISLRGNNLPKTLNRFLK